MAIVLSVVNQKGGVGKTTTSHALICGLAQKGFRVLGIDLDSQGNLSSSFGADVSLINITDVLAEKENIRDTIQNINGFDIIPSSVVLSGIESEVRKFSREYILKEALENLQNEYDFIVIDTPPALGFLTINAFTASNYLVIVSTPSSFSLDGIIELNNTIEQTKKYCNPSLSVLGILITKFKRNTRTGKLLVEVTEDLGKSLNAPVFNTKIRDSIVIEEMPLSNETDMFKFSGPVFEDYSKFVDECLERIEK